MASTSHQHVASWRPRPSPYDPYAHRREPSPERTNGAWTDGRTLPGIESARGRPWEEQHDARSSAPATSQQLPSVRSLLNPEPTQLHHPPPSHRPTQTTSSIPGPPVPLSSAPMPGLPTSVPGFRTITTASYPSSLVASSPQLPETRYRQYDPNRPDHALPAHGHRPADDDDPSSPRGLSSSRRRGGGGNRAPVRISRCLGQRHVPGEGLCFVYEDGSFCRTNIDGEPVNPSWGVTKAGKPRKRLAQACLTCREKKIKCEPGAGAKCVQCTKARRLCRGIYDQVSDHESSSRSGNPLKRRLTDFHSPSGGIAFLEDGNFNQQGYRLKDMYGKLDPALPPSQPSKPPCVADVKTGPDVEMPDAPAEAARASVPPEAPADKSTPKETALERRERYAETFERDPYDDSPELTIRLLRLYFAHVNPATYYMLPQDLFMQWVKTCRTKTADDRMLLYTLMAMGSAFTLDSDDKPVGKQLGKVARFAADRRSSHFTLQLVITRLVLSFFTFSRGKMFDAWDLTGASYRVISGMNYNMEEGIKQFDENPTYEFGLDRARIEEVRRRAFWSGFLMDRFTGFCGGTLLVIHSADTYTQLPGPEAAFESGECISGPLYDPDIPLYEPDTLATIGGQGHLSLVSSLWGDVLTFTTRYSRRIPKDFRQIYADYCSLTQQRADRWLQQLPPYLRWSTEAMDDSIRGGYAGLYISLYSMYHITFLRLYRHVRISELSPDTIRFIIVRSRQHARAWISIMRAFRKAARDKRLLAHASAAAATDSRSPSLNRPDSASTAITTPPLSNGGGAPTSVPRPPTSASPSASLLPPPSPTAGQDPTSFVFSTPFPGYTFLLAADVLSSGGRLRDLAEVRQALAEGSEAIDELAQFWKAARAQWRAIRKRLEQLEKVARRQEEERSTTGELASSTQGDDDAAAPTPSAPPSLPASPDSSNSETDSSDEDAASEPDDEVPPRMGREREAAIAEDETARDAASVLEEEDDDDEGSFESKEDMPPCWRLDTPLETIYARPDDAIYGTPDAVFFKALDDEEKGLLG